MPSVLSACFTLYSFCLLHLLQAGFRYLSVVDDGESVIGGAARIGASYRNKGIWRQAQENTDFFSEEIFSKAKQFYISSRNWQLHRRFLQSGISRFKKLILVRVGRWHIIVHKREFDFSDVSIWYSYDTL